MLNKPLIYWTIKQIKKINKKSTIIVSDSKKIRKISLEYNISVPFIRPNISKDIYLIMTCKSCNKFF